MPLEFAGFKGWMGRATVKILFVCLGSRRGTENPAKNRGSFTILHYSFTAGAPRSGHPDTWIRTQSAPLES